MPAVAQARIEPAATLPLSFEPNVGQAAANVAFLSHGAHSALYLTPRESVFVLGRRADVLRVRYIGSRPAPSIQGEQLLPGRSHYFLGRDPAAWRTDVPRYGSVRARELWPGVDLVYRAGSRDLEYDFVVRPGADVGSIRLRYEGARGLSLDRDGNLVVRMAHGDVVERRPALYQEAGGERTPVSGRFVLRGRNEVRFEAGAHDPGRALTIDPVLAYSTYLGGSGDESGAGIAVDASGSAYVTGTTFSIDFPGAHPFGPPRRSNSVVFVAKLDPSGSTLVYAAYLGGAFDTSTGAGIAVDAAGSAYVTGSTSAIDFPVVGAFQPGLAGGVQDAFVAKLSPSGASLVYSTYLGGSDTDTGSAITVDSSGSAYVAGSTSSIDFPTAKPLQAASKLSGDAFVAKLDPTGAALVYSTYLGGSGVDLANAIAVDASGAAYVTGSTISTDFPTVHARQSSYGGGTDAFVSKISADGSTLVYSTYLGGSATDVGYGIAVDCQGNAYVTGETISTNFPTASAFQGSLKGTVDAFVAKFDSSGSSLTFSTYLGGGTAGPNSALNQQGVTRGIGIAVDSGGTVTLVGTTSAVDFPVTNAYQGAFAGGPEDAFVAQLAPSGSSMTYATYLGGTFDDFAAAVALDPSGNVYLAGTTSSADFPTAGPFQAASGGGDDAFVVKIPGPGCSTTATPAISSPATVIAGQPYVLTWTPTLAGAGQYVVTTLLDGVIVENTAVATNSLNVTTSADKAGHALTFVVQAVPGCGAGCASGVAVQQVSLTQAACVAGPATLCIDDQPGDARFQVQVAFQTAQGGGQSGNGQAISLSSLGVTHGGVLWFFSVDNPEVLIKIVPACSAGGFHWVFASAGTNVGVTITVIDTRTGARRIYVNPDLHPMAPIQDTGAFACP
jgi:hypothetical protein